MADSNKVIWPGWDVVRVIGRGGFGQVYEIERNNFGNVEKAALKVITIPQNQQDIDELLNDGYDSESITFRFRSYLESIVNEYSLMQELKGNTNVVYCDDLRYIQHDDGIGWDIYIKMELLTPLMKALSAPVTDEQVIRLGMDICNALVLCKNRGIIHRDIKPQNIFVSKDGDYKLGDFGIAKITERTTSGTKVGTYKYMAPEVYNNQPYGSAADIYSLGLVMYWMLNERRTPFLPLPPQVPTVSMEDNARNRRLAGEKLPAPANGSEALKRIVLKACAPDPEERYWSAAEMREDLEALLQKTEGIFRVWEKSKTGEKQEVPRARNLGESHWIRQEVEQKAQQEVQPDMEEATLGLFPKRQNSTYHQEQTEHTVLRQENSEDLTKPDQSANEQQENQSQMGLFQLQNQLEAEKERNKRNKKVFAVIACGILVFAVILCIGMLPSNETEKDVMQEPNSTTDAPETAATTEAPEDILFREVQAHCVLLADSGDIFGAIQYAEELAEQNDDPRYAALVAEYQEMLKESILGEAEALAAEGQYRKAIQVVNRAWNQYGDADYYEAAARYRMDFGIYNTSMISAGKFNTMLLKQNGNVEIYGDNNFGELDAGYWWDIVAVSAGDRHVVGLKKDGTVVSAGRNDEGQCDVEAWRNIVAISSGDIHTVGIMEDGTVVSAGNNYYNQRDMATLMRAAGQSRIVAVSAGYYQTLALLENGSVIACGSNETNAIGVSDWTNIAAIYTGTRYSIGLKDDGTVIATGYDTTKWGLSEWRDIVNLSAGDYFLVGLKEDGTVVAAGSGYKIGDNVWADITASVKNWRNIVQIFAGHDHVIAVDSDGRIWCAGSNTYGQTSISGIKLYD